MITTQTERMKKSSLKNKREKESLGLCIIAAKHAKINWGINFQSLQKIQKSG